MLGTLRLCFCLSYYPTVSYEESQSSLFYHSRRALYFCFAVVFTSAVACDLVENIHVIKRAKTILESGILLPFWTGTPVVVSYVGWFFCLARLSI